MMNRALLDKIVNSVLYEGYMLYPYRRSALKNQHRWNFGLVYPAGMSPCMMVTECLLQGGADASVSVEVRFLQLHEEDSWQEAFERSVLVESAGNHQFEFPGIRGQVEVTRDDLQDGL